MTDEKACKDAFEVCFRQGVILGAEELDSASIVSNVIKRILDEQGKDICNLMWQEYIQNDFH